MRMHGHSRMNGRRIGFSGSLGFVSSSLAVIACLLVFFSCVKAKNGGTDGDGLVIYAYDSFVSEWGPGPVVMPKFEAATGIKAKLISKGDSGQVLAAAIDEKGRPQADIVIGIDQFLLPQAIKAGVLASYKSKDIEAISPRLRFDPEFRLTPFDYGHFAINWDSQSKIQPPSSLADLTKPEYKGKLILMDPRSSTVGLGFLAWTVSAYGDTWSDYWKSLKPSILTIASGWDSGYGLYTKGEAPLVLSYSTSPAYHLYAEKTDRYKALVFAQGHPLQIEGAGILKGAKNRKNAEKFIDFMISQEFQKEIPLTNWMYPVRSGVVLPDCYVAAIQPESIAPPDSATFAAAQAAWADVASK
jgi:thiamine transport system substrate-binding protein